MSLTAKTCTPCQGGIDPMTQQQAEAMMAQVPNWQLADSAKRIVRCYNVKDFAEALAFVNEIGRIAEEEGHHPDNKFGWGYVTVEIFTHKIGGLHENDFILAAKINALRGE
jgi:4a-hydroxytetrahydrobiopterin dehydratase